MSQNSDHHDQQVEVSAPLAQSAGEALELPERIAAIDQAAADYVRGQRPANTRRSYAGD